MGKRIAIGTPWVGHDCTIYRRVYVVGELPTGRFHIMMHPDQEELVPEIASGHSGYALLWTEPGRCDCYFMRRYAQNHISWTQCFAAKLMGPIIELGELSRHELYDVMETFYQLEN